MDYKYIVIIVIVLVLIFLFIREMAAIKEEINIRNKETKTLISTLDRKIEMGLNNAVNKIKVINGDYMVQTRKMNELGSQLIVPTASNAYSDSDSDKNNVCKYPGLSDDVAVAQTPAVNKDKPQTPKASDFKVSYSNIVESAKKSAHENVVYEESEKDDTSLDDGKVDGESIGYHGVESDESSTSSQSSQSSQSKPVSDHESIVTSDVKLTLDTLQPIEKYKKPHLDKIAKKYSIPTTYKEGSVRRPYKKEEIYEKIKVKLSSGVF